MSVVFEGSNVVAGIRSMVRAGLMQPPVPSVLARLPSTPANRYRIRAPQLTPSSSSSSSDASAASSLTKTTAHTGAKKSKHVHA